MKVVDPCSVCGSNDLNLVDGFYYCVECGTQDTNVRDIVVEYSNTLADGKLAQSAKRKILKIKDDKLKMSEGWHRWHTYNFILNGLADELIVLGAAPSFKTKLLWIWTRYMKKYLNKDELGLKVNNDGGVSTIMENTIEDSIIEEQNEETIKNKKTKKQNKNTTSGQKNIKKMLVSLMISMLYAALNLDKSDIQLSHLFRFIKERRLILNNFDRHIPIGIDVKAISNFSSFTRSFNNGFNVGIKYCREQTMTVFKTLDLGCPVLPDMKKIVTNYITELCLPDQFRNLVFSLIHFCPCDYLDIDERTQINMMRFPAYELVAMSYILVCLKMCFGLDNQYEYKLSDEVDKINEKEMHPKCYKLGFTNETTGRLFSFREWTNYLQFRRKMLSTLQLFSVNDEHYLDTDDYAFMEYLPERSKHKVSLTDELSMDILDKIQFNEDISVIPKNEFTPSLTPLTTYTEIITQHCKDIEMMQLLNEDFKQYSLKYACESLYLADIDDRKNIIVGVNNNKIDVKDKELLCSYLTKGIEREMTVKMVYIRNCENKNWLKTKKPTADHIILEVDDEDKTNSDSVNELQSDHGYDSNTDNISKDKVASVASDTIQLETISEEDEDKNIFDDMFLNIENDDETKSQDDNFVVLQEEKETINEPNEILNQSDNEDDKSVSSEDSYEFNPETFNRERAIKELILKACKKYKIPIPKEYRTTEPRKRRRDKLDEGHIQRKYMKTSERKQAKENVNKLLEAYYNYVDNDVINQVSKQVQSAIWQMNQNISTEIPVEQFNESFNNSQLDTNIINNLNESADANLSSILPVTNNNTEAELENMEPILFHDSDEGEVDDLIPKLDAQFDEKKYDINQLYIKMKGDLTDINNEYTTIKDPEINEILNREAKANQILSDNVSDEEHNKIIEESSDSEDDLPLKFIKEERDLIFKEKQKDNNYKALIENKNIPKFKYWMKHYRVEYMSRLNSMIDKFGKEMFEKTPRTFNFLLKECSIISGYQPFYLYRSLQNLEQILGCSAKQTN